MIAIIAAIAVISVIAIIGTSVDAENVVLCTESAERKCRENNIQLSSCTEWAGAGGLGGWGLTECSIAAGWSFLHPAAAAVAMAVGPQPIIAVSWPFQVLELLRDAFSTSPGAAAAL